LIIQPENDRPTPVWQFDSIAHLLPDVGFIKDYVEYACRCTDAPPLYHIISALGVASAAIAPQMDLVFEGETHPLHLYLLIVGDSSASRKSSAIRRAVRVAAPVFAPMSRLGERLWWTTVSSPEGIIEELAKEPNRLILLSEWTDLQRLSGAGYWKHNSELWNTVYDAGDVVRAHSKTKVTITRPRVSILGASTKTLVESATEALDWNAGKMGRYLIACATRPKHLCMDAEIEEPVLLPGLRQQLGTLCAQLSAKVSLSPEAWRLIRAWQRGPSWQAMVARAGPHLQANFYRAQEQCFRIAALYEVSSMPSPFEVVVRPETAQAAINLVDWCFESTLRTFANLNDHEQAPLQRAVTQLQAAGLQGLSRSGLLRATRATSKQLDEILTTLREREEIEARVMFNAKPGRPSTRFYYQTPEDD
jgi:hypothetical protein